MNAAWAHLLMNHIPVVGSWLVTILLLVAWLRRDAYLQRVSFIATVIIGLMVLPTYLSGGRAARFLQNFTADVSESAIDAHAGLAGTATAVFLVIALLALGAAIGVYHEPRRLKIFSPLLLLCLLGNNILLGIVAHRGAFIRHPEIAAEPSAESTFSPH